MKTHTTTLLAMGLVYLMSLFLFGCTQYSTAGKMDSAAEGTMTETTGKNMNAAMDTKENKAMKGDTGEMNGQKMEGTMDTMQGTMETTKDKMLNDSSKELMK
jgi:hypothetical protein